MADWGKVAKVAGTVAPLALGLFAGKKNKDAANKATEGSRLQDLLPQIQALIAQNQQHSQQNYDMQMQKYQSGAPLRDAMNQQAMSLMPNHAKPQGGGAMPQLAPLPTQAPAQLPMPPKDFTAGYQRRGGGTGMGVGSGALTGAGLGTILPGVGNAVGAGIGALAGGIGGAFTKKAATAPTDFAVDDARKILTQAYQAFFGKPADPGVIEQTIAGQGWQPGDRWVGEGGLQNVLRTWQQQAGH